MLRYSLLLVALAAMTICGCNAVIDVEEEYPLRKEPMIFDEVEMTDAMPDADPDNNGLDNHQRQNNGVNNFVESCEEIIRQNYPDAKARNGDCTSPEGEVILGCVTEYQDCIDERYGEMTCEEAVSIFEMFVGSTEPYTDEELLVICIEDGPLVDRRFTPTTCERLVQECEL